MLKILFVFLATVSCSVLTKYPDELSSADRWQGFDQSRLPVDAPVKVYWNENKIPFVEAQSDRDLAMGVGFVHAYLRLSQLYIFKMASQGRLSEMAGPFAVDIDKTIRILQLRKAVPEMIKSMPPSSKEWALAYVEGINAYAKTVKNLPPDMEFLGLEAEPFTLEDMVGVWRLVGIDINWGDFVKNMNLQKEARWKDYWQDSIQMNFGQSPLPIKSVTENLSALTFGFSKSGSNSIALNSSRSKTGKPMIANDPHVGIFLPPLWMIMGMKSPSYHAVGFMIPGTPFLALGRNKWISWGGTNMRGLSSYLYQLSEEDLRTVEETKEEIGVRWWFDEDFKVRMSRHGPIITDSPLVDFDKPIALKWAGHEVSDELTAFLAVNRAKNWKEFKDAFATYGVSSQNMVFADSAGNIGHVLALRKPIRKDPESKVLFNDDQNPVLTFRRSNELNSKRNPKAGYLTSANNNPLDIDPTIGMFFSSDNRIRRMDEIIRAKSKLSFDDLVELQMDVVSPRARELHEFLFPHILKDPNNLGLAKKDVQALAFWKFDYTPESRAALLFEVVAVESAKAAFLKRYESEELQKAAMGTSHWKEWSLEILKQQDSEFLSETIGKAAKKAKDVGSDFKNWGEYRRTPVQHLLGNVPVVGSRFVEKDLPARGNANTLHKQASSNELEESRVFYGQNARHISDMSDLDKNYFVLFGGNDGWLTNPNFSDQVDLWRKGKFIRVPLRMKTVRSEFSKVTVLMPSSKN